MRDESFGTIALTGLANRAIYEALFRVVESRGEKNLLVIGLGQNYLDGLPTPLDANKRKEIFLSCGAKDVRFLPAAMDGLDEESNAFCLAQTLLSLGASRLYLPLDGNSSMMDRLFLFACSMPRDYIHASLSRKEGEKNGIGHYIDLLEQYVPGSKAFLSKRQNVMAFRYYRVLRSTYSPVEPIFLNYPLPEIRNESIPLEKDQEMYDKLRKAILSYGDKPRDALADIYLGSEKRATLLLALTQQEKGHFSEVAEGLEKAVGSLPQARRYLLLVLFHYRKIDETVACLRGFVEKER